jgi:hypothetical protein
VNNYNLLVSTNAHVIFTAINVFIAVSIRLYGCELPEDGDKPKHVAAR